MSRVSHKTGVFKMHFGKHHCSFWAAVTVLKRARFITFASFYTFVHIWETLVGLISPTLLKSVCLLQKIWIEVTVYVSARLEKREVLNQQDNLLQKRCDPYYQLLVLTLTLRGWQHLGLKNKAMTHRQLQPCTWQRRCVRMLVKQ